jgi:hypothetical protein
MSDLPSNVIMPFLLLAIRLLWICQRPNRNTEQSLESIDSIITAIMQVPGNNAQFGENGRQIPGSYFLF